MNTLIILSAMDLNILLQDVSPFQMNLLLYLSLAIGVLIIIVLAVVYRALQIVLQASGLKPTNEELTIDWVNYLYVLTIGQVLISVYMYSGVA